MSLSKLLRLNQELESEIDSSEVITPEMCEAHFASMKSIDEKVEAVISYMDICKMNSARLESQAKMFSDKARWWETKMQSLENYCLWLLTTFPEVQGRGKLRTMRKKISNQPSFICNFTQKKNISNVLEGEFVDEIPEHFRERVEIWILNAARVKNFLKAGGNVNFGKLERKTKLEIIPKEGANDSK